MQDNGPNPFVVNIEEATVSNGTFRTAIWTGKNLQATVMSIAPGEDVGLEVHDTHDQFLRIEQGEGRVEMGDERDNLDFVTVAKDDDAIFVPAGKWHNITNASDGPLKLYSIYAPAEHAHGTIHQAKADDLEAHAH